MNVTATTSHGVTRKEAQNFDDEPRVQENQQVKDQQSSTSVFVSSNKSKWQLGAPVQTLQQYSIHGRMVDL